MSLLAALIVGYYAFSMILLPFMVGRTITYSANVASFSAALYLALILAILSIDGAI